MFDYVYMAILQRNLLSAIGERLLGFYCCLVNLTNQLTYLVTLTSGGPSLYAYYLQPDSFLVTNSTAAQLFQKCLETCYGYGNTGDCKSVYQAYNYPAPPMFGGAGGDPTTACIMFNRTMTITDFEVVDEEGKWTASRAGVVSCPAA